MWRNACRVLSASHTRSTERGRSPASHSTSLQTLRVQPSPWILASPAHAHNPRVSLGAGIAPVPSHRAAGFSALRVRVHRRVWTDLQKPAAGSVPPASSGLIPTCFEARSPRLTPGRSPHRARSASEVGAGLCAWESHGGEPGMEGDLPRRALRAGAPRGTVSLGLCSVASSWDRRL